MSLSLYNLTGQWLEMRDKLADAGFDDATIADTLDAESGEYDEKVSRVAMVVDEFSSMAESKKALAKKFTEEATLLENRAKSLREYLARSLATTGRTSVDHELIRVRLYIGRDEQIVISNPDDVPINFLKTKTETAPDKTAIKAALKSGGKVPGAELVKKDRLSFLH
ncbi:TPA: siphovirus Gp157 family protein [Burkholderia contaminans]|nr:siphovirus Gp157 family protein [Burkholderia contaminans]MBM6427963.1 siphovirus Gp157 family protein [Burkholderia contaminans]MCA7876793.1 siphovirus Gp157 family protein [Burkholderia contaminans]MDN8024183.1 siphovirus Gp157 family protein [Burkholderia contaminans]PRG12185.1 hypothetical protein C6Q17_14095 [Burkholderia contaminans]